MKSGFLQEKSNWKISLLSPLFGHRTAQEQASHRGTCWLISVLCSGYKANPLFPELSFAICAELGAAPEHFHLCFTSVYTLPKDTPGQVSDGEIQAESMLS